MEKITFNAMIGTLLFAAVLLLVVHFLHIGGY